ncbi:MAG TPA: DUF4333 domain-containing protein [Solirubrobacteraceae bacterium]|nr:DUF4333 domain-containing protein [Solirubrobacteraceae bacterium]
MASSVLAAMFAVAGCTKSVDTGSVEKALVKVIPGAKSAKCPSSLDAKKGKSYKCDVTGASGSAPYTITMTDDNGHFNVAPASSGAASGGASTTGGASTGGSSTTP